MPEPVPDGPQFLVSLSHAFPQRYAHFPDLEILPRYLRDHLGGEFHAVRFQLDLLQCVFSDPSDPAVSVVDLHTKLHSAAPRQERYAKFM